MLVVYILTMQRLGVCSLCLYLLDASFFLKQGKRFADPKSKSYFEGQARQRTCTSRVLRVPDHRCRKIMLDIFYQ